MDETVEADVPDGMAEAQSEGLKPGREAPASKGARAADILADTLAEQISAGALAEGARFPTERDLMQRYGVSRTVVRETIAQLASRGLLATRPGYRPVVRRPGYDRAVDAVGQFLGHLVQDPDGVRNLFETRIFLECALARTAARSAGKDHIVTLEAALRRNRESIGDRAAFHASDVDFHAVLYAIPGNPIYPEIHKAYVEWLMRHWYAIDRAEDIDRLNHAGHVAIFEAIVGRDADAAEQAIRRHLEIAWELVRTTFWTKQD